MRVYDTFLFSGIGPELDLLECRLRELENIDIYRHVIVEGTVTFQGDPKPLVYADNRERFKPWADRIRYVPMEPSTERRGWAPGAAWARERSARNATWRGIEDAGQGDIIIHGDVDEIPLAVAPGVLRDLADNGSLSPCRLESRWTMFAVDWLMPDRWPGPSACRLVQLFDFHDLRFNPQLYSRLYLPPYPDQLSWHHSWLGGPEAMRAKVHAFSHAETIETIEQGVAAAQYYERGRLWDGYSVTQCQAVDVDESWPAWIAERKCPAIWFRPRDRRDLPGVLRPSLPAWLLKDDLWGATTVSWSMTCNVAAWFVVCGETARHPRTHT